MNAVSEPALPSSAVNLESLKKVTQWLKRNGASRVRTTNHRRALLERYPVGLISEAELDALLSEV